MPNMKVLALMAWDKKILKVFRLPWQPEVVKEFKYLKYSESALTKDNLCVVSLKYVGRFQRRRFLSNCLLTNKQTDRLTTDTD